MKNRMSWFLVVIVLLIAPASWATTITFNPLEQEVKVGDAVFVDVTISGLGDHSAPSLGEFDLDVSYDEDVLMFYGALFGDPDGDQLDLSGYGADYDITSYEGGISLYGLSYDTPDTLDTSQAGAFILARVAFQVLGTGLSDLGVSIDTLGDADGNAITADTQNGNIHATPVPSALLLLGTGLAGTWAGISRKKRIKR